MTNWLKENWSKMALILLLLVPTVSFAHPGRTASDGCHYCRTNCEQWGVSYGARHCHRSKGVPQPSEPVRSHYRESGGYTTPAPDYKTPKVEIPKPSVTVPKTEVRPVVETTKPEVQPVHTTPVPISNTNTQTAVSVHSTQEQEHWFIRFLNWLF